MRDREEEDGVGVGVGREERGRVADMQSEVSIMMPGRGVIVMSGQTQSGYPGNYYTFVRTIMAALAIRHNRGASWGWGRMGAL